MTSPYATGGGGTFFEATVVSYYLAALLCEVPARGTLSSAVTHVQSQRGHLGAPLDDIVVIGVKGDGATSRLNLQIKNRLSFTPSDSEWFDVLARAWNTFAADEFDATHMRFGVGVGRYTARADEEYQTVLLWAQYSQDAADFFLRVGKNDFSSPLKAAFIQTIRDALNAHVGRAITGDELWRFLKCLLIIHFDFQTGEASRDAEAVRDRLRALFADEPEIRTKALWDHLLAHASRLMPVAGSLDRATLRQHMEVDGYSLAPSSGKRHRALLAIQKESERALAEIKSDIVGLRLHRRATSHALRKALDGARLIQITGEPGTGKSAVLKEFAEESARVGPVFVLKDARIQPRGWAAHAHVLGVTSDCVELLTDLASAGEPILFVDGIDKIVDPAVQITVNDVLRTIQSTPHLASWKVVMTVREQNLRHLETWMDGSVLKALPLASISIDPLNSEERHAVGEQFPQLRPLLFQKGIDAILFRPFFLNALLVIRTDGNAELPATEVALLRLWWSLGGTDQTGVALAQEQRDTLVTIGQRLAQSPGHAVLLGGLSASAVERLLTAGVIRNHELGHSVVFAHDIFEEWTLCEMLLRHRADLLSVLQRSGEAEILVRPLQLLGTYLLETQATSEPWGQLIAECAAPALRSVWQRAVLLSCLQSTRATKLLEGLLPYLSGNDARALRKLMLSLRTIEVIPNADFLNESQTPHVNAGDRAKYANLTAHPRVTPWIRFLDWFMPHVSTLPVSIVPDILPVFSAWMRRFAGYEVRHCREMGILAGQWLGQVEQELHPEHFADRKDPLGLDLPYKDEEKFEATLREIFLGSAAENAELVTTYLAEKAEAPRRVDAFRDEIMESAVPLATHVPTALVDFMLKTFLDHSEDEANDPFGSYASFAAEKVGITSDHCFYPVSPVQMPFLMLLRLHESEGLRLVHGFCNHSTNVWRWSRSRTRCAQTATPLPVSITLDGKPREFWGDKQVYQWYRGNWGNAAAGSALMALEWWALQELDAGTPFAAVFAKVVDPSASVAALGIAVSLCLAFPKTSLEQSGSLLICPHLWEWDIARWLEDQHPANQIGDWFRHRHELMATKISNERPHRCSDLRQLLPNVIFGSDTELRDRTSAGIVAFPERLPFEYEEQKGNPDFVANLTEKMKAFAEQGDVANWRMQQQPDGEMYAVWCDPPSAKTEKIKAQSDDHARLNEYTGLALWAVRTMDNRALDPRIQVAEAWKRVQAIDVDDAFKPSEDFLDQQRAAAIAGVAFVLARYSDDEVMLAWASQTVRLAAEAPERASDMLIRSSILSMHPKVFAVHGYAALLARDRLVPEAQSALLHVALHSLEHLAGSVFAAMPVYLERHRTFAWVLMDLAVGRSIFDRGHIPNLSNVVPDAYETSVNKRLLRRARRALAKNAIPTFPDIPMPWIKPGQYSWTVLKERAVNRWKQLIGAKAKQSPTRETDGYLPNTHVFGWHLVRALVFKAPAAQLMTDPSGVARMFALAQELRDFTIMQVVPPFTDSRLEFRGNTPFEWVYDCSAWLGDVLAGLPGLEAKKQLIAPILDAESETALMMLSTILRQFMFRALTIPKQIAEADLDLWRYLADWVLADRQGAHPEGEYLDRNYTQCVLSLLFCAASDFAPLRCAIAPGWPHLALFQPTVEKTIDQLGVNGGVFSALTTLLSQGGRDWLPEPALGWIDTVVEKRKADVEFWQLHGEDTVSLLKSVVSTQPQMIEALRQRIVRIADNLVDAGVRGAGFLQQEMQRSA